MNANIYNLKHPSQAYYNFFDKCLFYCLALLVLLPSITFGIISAEVFPWALVFYLVYSRNISKAIFIPLGFFTLSALYVVLVDPLGNAYEVIRSYVAYLNVLLIFDLIVLSQSPSIERWNKLINFLFIFLTIWGLVQFSGF